MPFRVPENVDRLRAAWRASESISNTRRASWRITNAGDTPKVYIYDVIGGWDLDASTFVRDLDAIDAESIDVHINSPGGFVYDGVAIYEALRNHSAQMNVSIDGLAASAASFIAMAGDSIKIAKPARMMIHDAQVLAYGSPALLREAADLGDAISDDIAGIYAEHTGGKVEDWRSLMQAETWYSSQQAVDSGLADSIKSGKSGDENVLNNRTRLINARARVMSKGR
jgi:ATP-dependent protease ClpP protease subunit